MPTPHPTPIYRLIHVENLAVCLKRKGMHAPKHVPADGLSYRTIHNVDIQNERGTRQVPCGPCGTIHDYVPFYFGPRSPMLLQLHTGRVDGYTEGQKPLIYVVSTVQAVVEAGLSFVFSDGHGIAAYSRWYYRVADLDEVDWDVVYADRWNDTVEEPDRQRRKQAEFLVHRFCPWGLVQEIGVLNDTVRNHVVNIIADHGSSIPVTVRRQWYY
ncbi:MAG: DUF4433 domain-containing protein [Chloroflexota bacterium]